MFGKLLIEQFRTVLLCVTPHVSEVQYTHTSKTLCINLVLLCKRVTNEDTPFFYIDLNVTNLQKSFMSQLW